MRWIAPLFMFVLVACTATSSVHAGWGDGWRAFKSQFHLDYRRNMAWPEPFAQPDRETVRVPFRTQIAKGWMLEATLTDHHFDAETNQLNSAGEAKVKWLARLPDPNRRGVYVLRGKDNVATSARFHSTQAAAAMYALEGSQPNVMVSDLAPYRWPADGVDQIHQSFSSSQPAPMLPSASGGTGGSTSP
ncbi:MAG: hypothetical protein NXI22_20510 [bacterium]|nr:hypothetical protein [bacterium]